MWLCAQIPRYTHICWISKWSFKHKTMACLIKALNKTKTEMADNGRCESNGLLTPFDCWHINRPLSRPTGGHWLHWSPCETSLERRSSQAASSMELLRSPQDSGSRGSQLRAPWSKAKVSRAHSGLYSQQKGADAESETCGSDGLLKRAPSVCCLSSVV